MRSFGQTGRHLVSLAGHMGMLAGSYVCLLAYVHEEGQYVVILTDQYVSLLVGS